MQAICIRETGWDVLTYRRQPMSDIFDLLEHITDNPPAYKVLGWLHLKQKPKKKRHGREKITPVDDSDMRALAQAMGGVRSLPPEMREMAAWAAREAAKLAGGLQ